VLVAREVFHQVHAAKRAGGGAGVVQEARVQEGGQRGSVVVSVRPQRRKRRRQRRFQSREVADFLVWRACLEVLALVLEAVFVALRGNFDPLGALGPVQHAAVSAAHGLAQGTIHQVQLMHERQPQQHKYRNT